MDQISLDEGPREAALRQLQACGKKISPNDLRAWEKSGQARQDVAGPAAMFEDVGQFGPIGNEVRGRGNASTPGAKPEVAILGGKERLEMLGMVGGGWLRVEG